MDFLLFIRLAQMCQQNTLTLIKNSSFTTSYKELRKRTIEEKKILLYNESFNLLFMYVYCVLHTTNNSFNACIIKITVSFNPNNSKEYLYSYQVFITIVLS